MTLRGAIQELYEMREDTSLPVHYALILADVINTLRTDAQEVRHGRWLFTREKTGLPKWTCSVCGGDGRGDYLRCPWCAAKMGKMGDNR